MIETYVYTPCTSCRSTAQYLKARAVDFESRDFFRDRFTRDELAELLARAGLKPSDILSTRSKPYTALGLAERELGEDELLDLMIEEPRLIKRPLVLGKGTAFVGYSPAKLDGLIAAEG
ncbi:MAG TPA: Spx/MgsR family RNA polymerase-binding regulatory protein [Thermomicrobiales bacterium]|nr:Spx/MgsR family RNA polymerase-binding regulatory protein [Thermomicrobiales bacterium]